MASERVKSWIYGVLNPWVDFLELQERLVADGNLTFRYRLAGLEYVRPIDEMLNRGARLILRDAERGRPELTALREHHQRLTSVLSTAATERFGALIEAAPLRQRVSELAEAWPTEAHEVSGDFESLVRWTAEHVVNLGRDLRAGDQGFEFWSKVWEPTFAANADALHESRIVFVREIPPLRSQVDSQRQHLVEEFDVPIAAYE